MTFVHPERVGPYEIRAIRGVGARILGLVAVFLVAACGGEADPPTQPTPGPTNPPPVVRPPFEGVADVGDGVIAATDPTTLTDLTPLGQAPRLMHDDRIGDTATVNAHLFEAQFADGETTQLQVNPEFDAVSAQSQAEQHAHILGQMPTMLRSAIDTVWIQGGDGDWWALWWRGTLLLHKGATDEFLGAEIAEELMLHEASHMGLDPTYEDTDAWRAAQAADGRFISDYGRDFPDSEDMAESFVAWVAARYRSDRISASVLDTIQATIPNRLAFFDALGLDLDPIR